MDASLRLAAALRRRFGSDLSSEIEIASSAIPPEAVEDLARISERASCREFSDSTLPKALVHLLAATALSAPSKSDLQQADLIIVDDAQQRARLAALVPSMPWVASAPAFLVFCANNRRIRSMAERRGNPFANDHLDAFFNASVDAGILLGTFVSVAEAAGLGCCPVSVLRNHSPEVSDILRLPDHVFAVAGMALGWPQNPPQISPRLNLSITLHENHFDEDAEQIEAYDRRRQQIQPYTKQRRADRFGEVEDYGWSEDKSRQYALPERTGFGAFIRRKGFRLD